MAHYIQVTRCDNSRKLLHHYSHAVDKDSDLVPGLSKFRAHVFNADQGGCELGPFWGNVEEALGIFARLIPLCELRHTCAGPDSLLPGGATCTQLFLSAHSCISRLCSGPFLSA